MAKDKVRNLLQDPSAAIIAQLFGFGVKPSSRGGFRLAKPDSKKAVDFLSGTPFENILNLAQPTPLTGSQELLTSGAVDLGGAALAQLPETFSRLGDLTDLGFNLAEEGTTTGFRTDVDDLVSRATRSSNANIAEEFSFLTGPFSADLGRALQESALDISAQLNFQADESAAGRRLQSANLLPLTALLATTQQGLPTAVGSDVLGFGQDVRTVAQSGRPEQATLDLLLALQGGSPFQAIPSIGSTSVDASTRALDVFDRGAGAFTESFGAGLGQGAAAGTICWAAAVYFDWFTPDWFAARRWITEGWTTPLGRAFLQFYLQHGRQLAATLRADTAMRRRWQPLFEWALDQGRSLR